MATADPKLRTQLTLRILERIQQHTAAKPITIPALAAEFNVGEREVKSCIEAMVDSGHKIGSSKHKPMGVFLARHPEEIRDTAERFLREGRKAFTRARNLLDWGGKEPTIFEQTPADMETAIAAEVVE